MEIVWYYLIVSIVVLIICSFSGYILYKLEEIDEKIYGEPDQETKDLMEALREMAKARKEKAELGENK